MAPAIRRGSILLTSCAGRPTSGGNGHPVSGQPRAWFPPVAVLNVRMPARPEP
jgi:hypothetical protein